jgi:hypothetical protein
VKRYSVMMVGKIMQIVSWEASDEYDNSNDGKIVLTILSLGLLGLIATIWIVWSNIR